MVWKDESEGVQRNVEEEVEVESSALEQPLLHPSPETGLVAVKDIHRVAKAASNPAQRGDRETGLAGGCGGIERIGRVKVNPRREPSCACRSGSDNVDI